MHTLVQAVETLVVVLAAAAFAHFGVTLKDAPCPHAKATVQRIPASIQLVRTAPCPLARDVRKT
jgi:hypothetical protein